MHEIICIEIYHTFQRDLHNSKQDTQIRQKIILAVYKTL